jgi:hypothetical protein
VDEVFCCVRGGARVHSQVPGAFLRRGVFSVRAASVTGYFHRGAGAGTKCSLRNANADGNRETEIDKLKEYFCGVKR